VNTVAVTPDPQVKVEVLEIPQEPFEDFNVKPEPSSCLCKHPHGLQEIVCT
jgi:hypothetical protein